LACGRHCSQTAAVLSEADTVGKVIDEVAATRITDQLEAVEAADLALILPRPDDHPDLRAQRRQHRLPLGEVAVV